MQDLPATEMPPYQPVVKDGCLYQDVKVLNRHGLHARPSAMFFERIIRPNGDALDLSFNIHGRNGAAEFVDIRSVFDLMALGLESGTMLTVRVVFRSSDGQQGAGEEIARSIYDLFLQGFGDKKASP